MRKEIFANGEYYHIFNRGTDKRKIFLDRWDMPRFLESMEEFNTLEPIGSIYENSFRKRQLGNAVSKLAVNSKSAGKDKRLVHFICYCLNPNHYHFILKQFADNGIVKFMHRLGLGYAKYFNKKYDRSGVLFQGPFRAVHIDSNEYLLHASAYVNLNYKVHKLGNAVSKSSWDEFLGKKGGICEKGIVLSQFKNTSEYKNFVNGAIRVTIEWRDMRHLILE